MIEAHDLQDPRLTPRGRARQAGSTLVLVLVLLVVLIVVAAIVIRGAGSDVSTAGQDRLGKSAFLCAESGIRLGMSQLAASPATFSATLKCAVPDGGTGCACFGSEGCPARFNNDGGVFVEVWLTDDADETGTNDPRNDTNNQVYINSRCVAAGLPPRQLQILYGVTGGGQTYANQRGGGSTNAGNQNIN